MLGKEKIYSKTANPYICKPISENTEQFREKIQLIFEKSNLIPAMHRVHYIKAMPCFQKLTYKTQSGKITSYDILPKYASTNNGAFSSHFNGFVSPGNFIHTNESGYSTHIDPYVSVSTKNYKPWSRHKEPKDITFWNWNSNEKNNLGIQKKNTQRTVLPLRKHSLRSNFQSEMSSNFNKKTHDNLDECAKLFKSVVLQPTDNIDYTTEYSNFENKLDCSRYFKQRKY